MAAAAAAGGGQDEGGVAKDEMSELQRMEAELEQCTLSDYWPNDDLIISIYLITREANNKLIIRLITALIRCVLGAY